MFRNAKRRRENKLTVHTLEFPIVSRDTGFKTLGTLFPLNGNTHAEFQERLSAGWAKFYSIKRLLLKRDANEQQRLRLFNATVSKTVLWCSESWKLTVAEKKTLRATQRSMLRKMVGPRRRPDDDYISWIKRATKIADEKARAAGVQCWCEAFLNAKMAVGMQTREHDA